MEHFHYKIPGWFTYPRLYSYMVEHYDNAHFVEVGSFQGASAAYMAVEIANSGKKIKFDCIDIWNRFTNGGLYLKSPESVPEDLVYQLFLNNTEIVREYINAIRAPSTVAASWYKDSSLDFIFIDANHEYPAVRDDLNSWFPKLKKGGHIAGHDWDSVTVSAAVKDFFVNKQILIGENCWYHYNE